MVTAVELLPRSGIGEPVVGAAVDDDGVLAELGGELVRLPVRQRQEDRVVSGEDLGGCGFEDPVGQRQQVRLMCAEPVPRVAERGDRADGDVRVAEQQAQQLAARVAAGAGHRNAVRHVLPFPMAVSNYTTDRMNIQSG